MEIATVHRADWVVADSPAIALSCAPLYRRPADSIIPHAIPFSLPVFPSTDQTTGKGDVLTVGRLDHRKGIDILLHAWPIVHRHFPHVRLHVVGLDRRGVARRFAHLQAVGVVFHGHLSTEALAQVQTLCAIQVVPSRFESFGLVVLEAWAKGLAVITSDIPALRTTVADAGVLFASQDHQALAQALSGLLADKAHLATLQQAGYARLMRHHHMSSWISATRKTYARMLEKVRRRQQFKRR
jgi:glycosyltransferase involved in cell wall biosynthesis